MLTKLRIKNFKSIIDDTIELGAVNVFIGENGCGKTNILEALGFLSCWAEGRLDNELIIGKGIRLAHSDMMRNAFNGKKEEILIEPHSQTAYLPLELNYLNNAWKDNTNGLLDMQGWINGFAEDTNSFLIYAPTTPHLRGLATNSYKEPLGIYGENLDVTIATLNTTELEELKSYGQFISWLSDFTIDIQDILKLNGLKANRGISRLYFKDKFMKRGNNLFSAENANEGVLYLLFYLTLLISNRTPKIFAIDNIESALNPHLCTKIMEIVSELTIKKGKQALITTHNPAILDGLDLNDDRVRLFEVYRDDKGGTRTRRIKTKPDADQKYKLSELWMRGYLGAISKNF